MMTKDIYITGYSDDSSGGTSFVSIAMPRGLISPEDENALIEDLTQFMAQWIDGRKSPDYEAPYPKANARDKWVSITDD